MEEKDFDVTPLIDILAKTIDRLEGEGQLIRPVANALRKAADIQTPEEEPFKLAHEEGSSVEVLAIISEEQAEKLTKANLIAMLGVTNTQILSLKAETDDVRRIAEHYRGLVAAHEMSAGAIHLLEVKTRENDMANCRELIGSYFHLNETETDNLGNQGGAMVESLLSRFTCFTDEVRQAMCLLDFIIEACDDDGCLKKVELFRAVRALLNMALWNKGQYKVG